MTKTVSVPLPPLNKSLPSTRSKSSPRPPKQNPRRLGKQSDQTKSCKKFSLPIICEILGTVTPSGTAKTVREPDKLALLVPSAAIAVIGKSIRPDKSAPKLIFKSLISFSLTRHTPFSKRLPRFSEEPSGIPKYPSLMTLRSASPLKIPIST